jgi:hypothetical protein
VSSASVLPLARCWSYHALALSWMNRVMSACDSVCP